MVTAELSAEMNDHGAARPDGRPETTRKRTTSTITPPPDPSTSTAAGPPAKRLSPPSRQPSMAFCQGSPVSSSSRRPSTPSVTPAQLAFSAMQALPVPLLVLSRLKTVVLANEAIGRLLGVIPDGDQEEKTVLLDRLRGHSLSQLGINLVQDGGAECTSLDTLVSSLASGSKIEDGGPERSDVGQGLPNQTTIDAIISKNDLTASSPYGSSHLETMPLQQRRAKVTITPFEVDDETYFTLTFTNSSPDFDAAQTRRHPTSKHPVAATSEALPTGAATTPRDAADVDQQILRVKDEYEARFKAVCDAMSQPVWTATADGAVDVFNRRWYEYTGLTPEQSVGHGWAAAVHPDDVAEADARFRRSLATGEPFEAQYRCRAKGGEWRWFVARALPLRAPGATGGGGGAVERWLGVCTDADEVLESRRRVERNWQLLLTVIAHAELTVFQVDSRKRIIVLEGKLVEALDAGRDLGPRWYYGRDMYEVFRELKPKARDGRRQMFLETLEALLAGQPAELIQEDEIEGRAYRTRFLTIGKEDEDGQVRGANIEGVMGVIRDVTELRSKDKDIEARAREKKELVASEAAAKEASKLKSQFLANMSHEIRTPITGVIGMAELLLDLDLGEEQREFTENIYRSGNALLTVINDILDFSKVESGRLDVEEVQFSLSVIVRDVNKMLGFAAHRKNLDFSSYVSPDIEDDLVVMGDPGRVRQIITNLLTNSIKFTNQGHVKFSVMKEAETADMVDIKFVIEDTGIGIEEEVRKKLFVPFSQGDSSTARKFGGTGLGLTICKSLLDLMHGRITLESIIGSGTTATFWIPFNKPQSSDTDLVRIDPLSDRLRSEMSHSISGNSSDQDSLFKNIPSELATTGLLDGPKIGHGHTQSLSNVANSVATSTEEPSASDRAGMHVLVVEDNAINQQIATRTIKKLGYNVAAAWNGKEALEYLAAAQAGRERKPDVILMDVQMPVIDGYKCTHVLRHHVPYKAFVHDVPIVAMTASAIQGDREKCRKAGMDDYLAKPVRGKILERMLARWTGRRRPEMERFSSHGSEVSTECSQVGEHCDDADIPCVEHDDADFLDLQRPLPLAAVVLPRFARDGVEEEEAQFLPVLTPSAPQSQWAPAASVVADGHAAAAKPRLTRSDTEETQLVRKTVASNDSGQSAARTMPGVETDGELAAQSRDVKLFDAAGPGPPQQQVFEVGDGASGAGEALTEENMQIHQKQEAVRRRKSHG